MPAQEKRGARCRRRRIAKARATCRSALQAERDLASVRAELNDARAADAAAA